MGPDPGVRFNYRFGRFIKNLAPSWWHWRDDLYYVQAQAYWILAAWALYDATGDSKHRHLATTCSSDMLARQRDDGAWDYPNPEWHGRVATAEGTWGSIGMLETYRRTREERFLRGVLRWHDFLTNEIGFQRDGRQLAVNYFAHQGANRVPNNSVTVLRFLAELRAVTGAAQHGAQCAGLVTFINSVQRSSGELPYAVPGVRLEGKERQHFQCYQYAAFECLGLLRYYQLSTDAAIVRTIQRLIDFLRGGISRDGHLSFECGNQHRAVVYHATAAGAALVLATRAGFGHHLELAGRLFGWALAQQRKDGSFPYSTGDYYVLWDSRAYPRYLAMVLHHLLAGDSQLPARPDRVPLRSDRCAS